MVVIMDVAFAFWMLVGTVLVSLVMIGDDLDGN